MSRVWFVLVVCVAVVAVGCRKKPEEPAGGATTSTVTAPAGMKAIPGVAGAYIDETPVTVGQYLSFLDETGQSIPDELASAQAVAPIIGLSIEQAQEYATWRLRRLPTAAEWAQVSDTMGSEPYPWAGDPPRRMANSRLFLVLDYEAGSPGQASAEVAKQRLSSKFLARYRDVVAEARKEAEILVATSSKHVTDVWANTRPQVLGRLEEKKQASIEVARAATLDPLLVDVESMVQHKYEAVRLKVTGTAQQEIDEAIEAYENFLAGQREKAQAAIKALQESNKSLQDRKMGLTRRLDQAEEVVIASLEAAVADPLDRLSMTAADLSAASRLRELKDEAQSAVQAASDQIVGAIERLPSEVKVPDQAGVPEKLDELTKERRELEQKLPELSEFLGREFINEGELLQDLSDLLELRTLNRGIEGEVQGLQKVLSALGETAAPSPLPEESAEETPGPAPDTAVR